MNRTKSSRSSIHFNLLDWLRARTGRWWVPRENRLSREQSVCMTLGSREITKLKKNEGNCREKKKNCIR
jgi:hypothetical protein